jgi:phosphatidylglycerophosphatase C
VPAPTASDPTPLVVAAFDFDGTIARRDTLVPFLFRLAGPRRATQILAAEAGRARGDREALKEAVLARLVTGRHHEELAEIGRAYAESLPRLLRPTMVEQLRWHRDAGHQVVVVSASLHLYLEPLAEHLGAHHVISVELETDDAGQCTGRLVGANVRGPEKEARLRAWCTERFGGDPLESWAYGASSGDRELLRWAHRPVPVTTKAHRLVASGGPSQI